MAANGKRGVKIPDVKPVNRGAFQRNIFQSLNFFPACPIFPSNNCNFWRAPMSYTIDRLITDADFETVDARTRKALMDNGFGVLTEIDVKATMKKKINEDMADYRILGACNPGLAFQAIGHEARIGAMLPCNVILRTVDGGVEVSAIDPQASMLAVKSEGLQEVAAKVRDMLKVVVDAI